MKATIRKITAGTRLPMGTDDGTDVVVTDVMANNSGKPIEVTGDADGMAEDIWFTGPIGGQNFTFHKSWLKFEPIRRKTRYQILKEQRAAR